MTTCEFSPALFADLESALVTVFWVGVPLGAAGAFAVLLAVALFRDWRIERRAD